MAYEGIAKPNDLSGREVFIPRRDLIAPKVYVLRCGEYVKIGWATDLTRRMRTIQRMMPYDLTILNTARGGKQEEKALHQRFAAHRHRVCNAGNSTVLDTSKRGRITFRSAYPVRFRCGDWQCRRQDAGRPNGADERPGNDACGAEADEAPG